MCLLSVMTFALSAKKPQYVYLVGDETMSEMTAIEDKTDSSAIGWGQVLNDYIPQVEIINRAIPGVTTRALLTGGDWTDILNSASRGSIMMIQLGHHEYDETDERTYSSLEDFENNLLQMVEMAQKNKVRVVLLTPTTKRFFYDGAYYPRHGAYAEGVRRVAARTKVPLIDIEALTRARVEDDGEMNSGVYFASGSDVNLSEDGARMVAQMVANAAKEQKIKGLY